MRYVHRLAALAAFLLAALVFPPMAEAGRRVICLDGTWQIAEGSMDAVPEKFDRRVPVPGLVDMARPEFADVGVEAGKKHREAFWYRRTFTVEGEIPAVARLKIHKAKFGTRVYLNGKPAGDHLPCFTPAAIDVRPLLRGNGATNELVVRVGAFRDAVPRSIPDGWDFEKVRYLPGIYDSVELILSNSPYVVRVQTVPEFETKTVRVLAVVKNAGSSAATAEVACRVSEASTGNVAGSAKAKPVQLSGGEEKTVELSVPIEGCRLWSPEDPFLYKLEVTTGADTLPVRFGMRTFRFDPKTKLALLNGKIYPMRGTNVCIYRFFEDPARGDRPWRGEWVRRLHKLFRSMNWNAARYCIGFPPEAWYDIADEEGILIQDEFPIWFLGNWPAELKSDELVEEYTAWMQERCNHPCVVIWDAQNESRTEETGKAIQAVRQLDLSGRPWDNGWSPPQDPLDVYEAHPYPFYSAKGSGKPTKFRLSDFAGKPKTPGVPGGLRGNVFPNKGGNPVVINEYGWLWLNRDGTPTTLSAANYEALLGPDATADQRRELYARYLAAMTEFWRSGRKVAGVLHFCGLGYSRPGGETSDHFLDLEKLTLDPYFREYVGEAFAPVGLTIDFWADEVPPGQKQEVPVVVLNDTYQPWHGRVRLRVLEEENVLSEQQREYKVGEVGREEGAFAVEMPAKPGRYELVAELTGPHGKPVRSRRRFRVVK